MAEYDVFGVGNAIVDVQARINDGFLSQAGLDKGIMTLVEDDQQAGVLHQLNGHSLHRCAGGSVANSIVAIAEFGGTASFAGKTGDDEIGRLFLDEMRELGVAINTLPAALPSATCVVLITEDAQRTMLTNLAASATLSPDDIDEALIKDAKYIYVEGYLLTGGSGKDAAYRSIEIAKKHGTKVALTAADPFLVNMIRDELWDLIEGPVDLLFCNQQEAASLTGKEDPVACAAAIHEHAENVAMTLGANGSVVMHGGEAFPIEGVAVEAVDTTGAGDMYAGGLLYGITNGMTWQQAGRLASHAAARIVGQMGARLNQKFTPREIAEITS